MSGRLTTIALVLIVVGLVVGKVILAEHHEPKFAYQVVGYKALIGFVGAGLFIIAGKWLGKHLLQRPEDFDER